MKNIILFFLIFAFFKHEVIAQNDTTKGQAIEILSSYKPVLRNAVKINFSSTQLIPDTSKSVLPYSIPKQNIYYTYRALALKPLAIQPDSIVPVGDRHFVKAGLGNFRGTYLQANTGWGDGRKYLLNIYGDYYSTRGKIENQIFNIANLTASGSYLISSHEFTGSVGLNNQQYHQYGYDHLIDTFKKDSVKQYYRDIHFNLSLRNIAKNALGIHYHPTVRLDVIRLKDKTRENNISVSLPVSKKINSFATISLKGVADLTYYSNSFSTNDTVRSNHLFYLEPGFDYMKSRSRYHAGITPVWDNGKLIVLPQLYGETKIIKGAFLTQIGLVGSVGKNNFQQLFSVNPWVSPVANQQNTSEVELYAGLKGLVSKLFQLNVRAGFVSYKNLPLFLNDTIYGKDFMAVNETAVNNFRIKANIAYSRKEKFFMSINTTINLYNGMKSYDHAWGMMPFEAGFHARWQPLKSLWIKSDCWAFAGIPSLSRDNSLKRSAFANDCSLGAEYNINKHFSAWLDVNNIFNNKYQRWNNYSVLGFNVLGGIIYRRNKQ